MFCNFAKNSKIQNGRHFLREIFFFKIGMATLQRYPADQKFHQNRSIQQGFRDKSIFMFCNFCEKFENSKWPPFLVRQNFFQNWDNYSAEIPCGSKISSKSLYLARFSRYKHFYVLQFLRKIRTFKMAAIFCEKFFFLKLAWLLCRDTLRIKNFVKIALSSRVFEIKAFLCFAIFAKNSKIQNGRHFW